jgi:hypothetical protein
VPVVDPTPALLSFQEQFANRRLVLHRGDLDRALRVHLDDAGGSARFTYVYLDGKTVSALAMFVPVDAIDGLPCFQAGCAVPEAYRKKGLAQRVTLAGMAELQNGLARNGVPEICVEAIVAVDNDPSNAVARKVFSPSPKLGTDHVSGEPAYHYVRRLEPSLKGGHRPGRT